MKKLHIATLGSLVIAAVMLLFVACEPEGSNDTGKSKVVIDTSEEGNSCSDEGIAKKSSEYFSQIQDIVAQMSPPPPKQTPDLKKVFSKYLSDTTSKIGSMENELGKLIKKLEACGNGKSEAAGKARQAVQIIKEWKTTIEAMGK